MRYHVYVGHRRQWPEGTYLCDIQNQLGHIVGTVITANATALQTDRAAKRWIQIAPLIREGAGP